ncbi:MAG: ferredoxin [Deltaproteobacteria bacterium]|nr:ferredoxin [Deltaproteobacteria bacterium]MBW2658216.1 ferredoxin [Deltaproteobacteria bacterium]
MKQYPTVDLGLCNECMGCVEVAPNIFRYNKLIGFVEVVDMDDYPQKDVDEAIKNCPQDCISWERICR